MRVGQMRVGQKSVM